MGKRGGKKENQEKQVMRKKRIVHLLVTDAQPVPEQESTNLYPTVLSLSTLSYGIVEG